MTKTMTKTITKIIATMTTIDLKNNQIYHIIMCIHLYMCYAMCLYVCVDAFINVFGLVCAFISVCLCLSVCISVWSFVIYTIFNMIGQARGIVEYHLFICRDFMNYALIIIFPHFSFVAHFL